MEAKQFDPEKRNKAPLIPINCHCCGEIARDVNGNLKQSPICYTCIRRAGATNRPCALHHPEYYDDPVD